MKDNIIKEKSYSFALRIIKLYKYLLKEQNEYVLSRQILRCGTSIGANVEEAIGGVSRKEFIYCIQGSPGNTLLVTIIKRFKLYFIKNVYLN